MAFYKTNAAIKTAIAEEKEEITRLRKLNDEAFDNASDLRYFIRQITIAKKTGVNISLSFENSVRSELARWEQISEDIEESIRSLNASIHNHIDSLYKTLA